MPFASRGVDPLIELGRLDEAQALLEDAKRYDDRYLAEGGQRDPNLPFTVARLQQAVLTAVAPADARTTDAKAIDDYAGSVRASIEAIARLGCVVPQQLLDQLATEAAANARPSTAREVVDRVSQAYRRYAAMPSVELLSMMNSLIFAPPGWPLSTSC